MADQPILPAIEILHVHGCLRLPRLPRLVLQFASCQSLSYTLTDCALVSSPLESGHAERTVNAVPIRENPHTMRLLKWNDRHKLSLTADLADDKIPPYAILSHTWGEDGDEVTFADLQQDGEQSKAGYKKLHFCGEQAQRDKIEHFWVDTCCINKNDQLELSEAITSMFRWYKNAQKCYVYLSDVPTDQSSPEGDTQPAWEPSLRASRWFTRGWTLQELLAPSVVEFYSRQGDIIGTKTTLEQLIHEITTIPIAALHGTPLTQFPIAERIRWSQERQTKKIEDKAYCLLGIFDVFMPFIYGERDNALRRLHKEIKERYGVDVASALTTAPRYGHHFDNTIVSDGSHAHFGDNINNHYYVETRVPSDPLHLLLASLTFDHMDERIRNVAAPVADTSGWLPSHSHFAAWIDQNKRHEHHGFLWLKGKPGSGKSTIMRQTLDWARRTWPDQIVLSYFFNARSPHALEKSSLGLYRSLMWHLQNVLPTCRTVFVDRFQSKLRHKEVEGRIHTEVTAWRESELQNFLVTVIEEFPTPPITVFIDALDEGADDDIRAMVDFLKIWTDHATMAACPLRVCLSSRHFPRISVVKSLSVVVEQETEHDEDIERYVSRQLVGGERRGMNDLRRQVCDRSAGIFLWVVLVVPMLNKAYDQGKKTAAVLQKLKTVPPDLHDVFSQSFFQDVDDLDECVTLLRWVLFAKRPLRPIELYCAVQHSYCSNDNADDDEGDSAVTLNEVTRYLLHCSRGLVELTKAGEPVVQFIHETVRDYLMDSRVFEQRRSASAPLNVSPQDFEADTCQQRLSEDSLSYLLQTFKQTPSIEEIHSRYPFAPYAAEYWWQHYRSSQSSYSQKAYELALDLLTGDQYNLLSWVRLYDLDIGRSNLSQEAEYIAPALYYTALLGRVELAAGVLSLGLNVNARGRYHGTALEAASREGHTQIVQILLNKGANDYNGALYRASTGGHIQIVQTLLEKGADDYNRALSQASWEGYTQIVQILLDKGADGYNDALYEASGRGHTQIVQILLEKGADDYNKALYEASIRGRTQIVQILLDKGADDYNEALYEASGRGHTQIVQILLDKGADKYNIALYRASTGGHTQIVQILLNKGANDYNGALHGASIGGHTQIVQILLDKGANDYNEALHGASIGGHTQIVQILLDKGANYYSKALYEASTGGHTQIVQILLDKGADNYNIALYGASTGGHTQIVQTLLEKGADDYNKALHRASWGGHTQTVQILLDKGADDFDGALPLASGRGHTQIVQLLRNHKARYASDTKADGSTNANNADDSSVSENT